jgi:hypothetical protein
VTEDRPLTWGEIYDRLARRADRPDPRAWAVLGERVRAWTRDADLADETCAEVWRTFNLAHGGPSFEGFVQGRLVAVTRRLTSPPNPLPGAESGSQDPRPASAGSGSARGSQDLHPARTHSGAEQGKLDPHPTLPLRRGGQGGGLIACLEELRARNPTHHRVLALLYEDRATVDEAADLLGVDPWTVRSLAARASMALAQCLERAGRQRGAGASGDAEQPPEKKDRRAGRAGAQPGRQQKGRPRRGGRPR